MEYLVKMGRYREKTSTAKIGEVLYKDNGIVATVLRDIFLMRLMNWLQITKRHIGK